MNFSDLSSDKKEIISINLNDPKSNSLILHGRKTRVTVPKVSTEKLYAEKKALNAARFLLTEEEKAEVRPVYSSIASKKSISASFCASVKKKTILALKIAADKVNSNFNDADSTADDVSEISAIKSLAAAKELNEHHGSYVGEKAKNDLKKRYKAVPRYKKEPFINK